MRFPRPQNTINDVNDLKVGDEVFHVYGIFPPRMSPESLTIIWEAMKFREHPECSADSSQGLIPVFGFKSSGIEEFGFATDYNLVPGYTHNDNYIFRTKEDAIAAQDYLTWMWNTNPELIAEEMERRQEMAEFEGIFLEEDYYG